jgi:hypothetical protein
MTTIDDLPLETIERIFSVASYDSTRQRYETLRAAALVRREWTLFAQRELWRDVHLFDALRTRQFVEAGPGRHPVETLSLTGGVALEHTLSNDWELILRQVRGLNSLTLSGGAIQPGALCGSNLKGECTATVCRSQF